MESQIEEIKAKTDIVALIGQTVKLSKAGRNFKGLCPFHHERTPSFMVSPERGTWRCFGCGEHGDAITFLEKYENLTFIESLEQLAQRAGVELKQQKQDPHHKQQQQRLYQLLQLAADYYHFILTQHAQGKEARDYLDKRGIKEETIKKFTLGYAPNSWQSLQQFLHQKGYSNQEISQVGISSKGQNGREFDRFRGRLMFPISDSMGRIVGFSGRSLSDSLDTPKYLNSPEGGLFHKGRLLFGLAQAKEAIRDSGRVVLVEGNVDLLSSHQAGVSEVVAPLGTALTEDQVRIIKKFTQNIYLAYDQDKAGQAALWRSLPLLQAQQMEGKIVDLPYGKDPDECIRLQPQLWQQTVSEAKEVFIYLLSRVSREYDLNSIKGKKEATETVAPFIAATQDPVAQAFLIHQAADAIGVEEQLLKTIAQKKTTISRSGAELKSANHSQPAKASHQEILATYLLSTILTTPAEEVGFKGLQKVLQEVKVEAMPQAFRPILLALQQHISTSGAIRLNEVAEIVPAEARPLFEQLSLTSAASGLTDTATIPAGNTKDDIADRLLHTSYQLNSLYLKARLSELTEQIKRASILGQLERDNLKKEFTQISEEIREYNNKRGIA